MHKVSFSEWAWVLVVSILILAILSGPYLIGVLSSTPQMHFGGFLFGIEDMNSYVAKMRYGAYSPDWLFRMMYTTEPHQGGFVYGFYIGLGKLIKIIVGQRTQITTDTLIVVYHAARVISGLLLLIVLYRFIAE